MRDFAQPTLSRKLLAPLAALLALVASAIALLIEDRLAAATSDTSLLATDAAEALVAAGTPFRKAHEEVGRTVRAGKLQVPWNAEASLRKRDTPGAPNPRRVAARATAVRREAARLRQWSKTHPPPLPT